MIAYKLTSEQAAKLAGQYFTDGSVFNPIKIGSYFYIFEGEVLECTNEEFAWVKDLKAVQI